MQKSLASRVIQVLAVWSVAVVSVFSTVYVVDQAGWQWHRLTGFDIALAQHKPIDQSLSNVAARYDLLSLDSQASNRLLIRTGTYEINETMVIPPKTTLMIEPGTTLRFGAGTSLISYSPIIAIGTSEKQIAFKAAHAWLKWGVVGVVSAGKSVFENVSVSNGRWAVVNDVTFPGTLSFVDCDADILKGHFSDLYGKDAVYATNGKIQLQQCDFQNVYKDGIDFDGASGEISHCKFVNCNDEGIDLSGDGTVNVFHNIVLDKKGGRIASDRGLETLTALNQLGYSNHGPVVPFPFDCRVCRNVYK